MLSLRSHRFSESRTRGDPASPCRFAPLSRGRPLVPRLLLGALAQLADTWVDTIAPDAYARFLNALLRCCCRATADREGGGRDGQGDGSESLSFLIDSLEVGAETFSPIEKQLALASYGSPLSPDPAHAAAKRKAAEGAAQAPPAQPHEGGAPPKRPKPKGPKSPKAKPKGSASQERPAK